MQDSHFNNKVVETLIENCQIELNKLLLEKYSQEI